MIEQADRRRIRAGAVLLIVGGVANAVQFTVGILTSNPTPLPVQVAYTLSPLMLVVLGFVLVAFSIRGAGRLGLLIAEAVAVIDLLNRLVQMLTGGPRGIGPSLATEVLSFTAFTIAVVIASFDPSAPRAVRMSLPIPVLGTFLFLLSGFLPLKVAGLGVLPAVAEVIAGLVMLGAVRSRETQSAELRSGAGANSY